MATWVDVSEDSDFSLHNLPYGIFSTSKLCPRIGVAIGNRVLDLKTLAEANVFKDIDMDLSSLQQETLNSFASQGNAVHRKVRKRLQDLLKRDTKHGIVLRDHSHLRGASLIPLDEVTMHLPMAIGDFTDHFLGLPHAKTVSHLGDPCLAPHIN